MLVRWLESFPSPTAISGQRNIEGTKFSPVRGKIFWVPPHQLFLYRSWDAPYDESVEKYILYNTYTESAIANLSTGRNIFAVTVGYKFGY